jgi:addiction module HigA family antidote
MDDSPFDEKELRSRSMLIERKPMLIEQMMMKTPCHPGEIIREDVLAPLGLTVTQAAKVLGVTRQALSNMLNGSTSLTAEMALRVEKAFGPKMEHLMRMQLNYDLAQARAAADSIKVDAYRPAS